MSIIFLALRYNLIINDFIGIAFWGKRKMNFYSYSELIQQNNNQQKSILIVSGIILLILIIIGVLWFYHKTNLKYRDLFIITLLLLCFFIGFQVNRYQTMQDDISKKSQVTQIMKQVAEDKKTSVKNVWSNTSNVNNGMLIMVNHDIYNVSITPDGNGFYLAKAHTITNSINYVRGKK